MIGESEKKPNEKGKMKVEPNDSSENRNSWGSNFKGRKGCSFFRLSAFHGTVVEFRYEVTLGGENNYCYNHGKSLPSNASLMGGKRVLQGEVWSDFSDSYGTHDLGD
ncbi:hypothetical protein AVEN_268475-1 [Araneus ventricosus]|uniref:Uncharacterized protein n=1 Tax=Araneus ventricosus TaxID=182803 RepID=A0A4Y2R0L0_ARAVE|nr:hypothetical protein AVEN_268475-1 [Araneus ventricosus]